MPKTIVVGVGGTGFDVIRNLRKRIVESNPKMGLAGHPNVGFFYIDTDPKEMRFDPKKKKLWEVMGQDISLRESEYVRVEAPSVGSVIENLEAYPQVNSWLPIEKLDGMDVAQKHTPGAYQIRTLGKMIYTLCVQEVKERFLRILNRLREDGQDEPQIYLACSLSGGTGAGMFLDIGYSIKHWLASRGKITSFLILPDLTLNRDRRYFANAYGALMDLNYYSLPFKEVNGRRQPICFPIAGEGVLAEPGSPFDNTYLLSPENQEGVVLSLSALPEMVAHRIYLSLDREMESHVESNRSNSATKRGVFLYDPIDRNQFSQNFSSFGLSAIVSPTEEIREIVVYEIIGALLKSWTEAIPVPNVNQEVEKNLSSHRTVDAYLLGNQDIFDKGSNYAEIEADVDRQLDEMLRPVTQKPREPKLNDVMNNFQAAFRGGMEKFYNIAEANKEGAADILASNIQAYLSRALLKPELGVPYAITYLQELIVILGAKKQEYLTKGNLDSKIKSAGAAVTAAIGQVTQAEGQMMFAERDASRALGSARAAMSILFRARAYKRAYYYGQLVLDLTIVKLEKLGTALQEWQVAVNSIRTRAERERETIQEHLKNLRENTHLVNGKVLFDQNQIAEIMSTIPLDQAIAYANERIAAENKVLEIRTRLDESLEKAYQLVSGWLTENGRELVTAKNIAQRLLEQYPGENSPERAEALKISAKKSAPFLRFDHTQLGVYSNDTDARYDNSDQNARFRLAGLMSSEDGQLKEVVKIQEELLSATGLQSDSLRSIVDTNQIVFISEISAFPLRLLNSLNRLKEYYLLESSQGRRSLPLLLAKSYQPPMGDLQLITQAQLRQSHENEENFVLGWVARDLRVEQNLAERRDEVRFYYREMGQDQFSRVAGSREEAFEVWRGLTRSLEEEKRRLTDIIHYRVSGWVGYDERLKVGQALDVFLEEIRNSARYGKESQQYQQFQAIIARIKKKYDLYREDTAPAALDPVKQAASAVSPGESNTSSQQKPDASGTFRAYVADLLDRRKGVLSEALKASIARREKELGLGSGEAQQILREEQSIYETVELSVDEQYRRLVSTKLSINRILSPDDEDQLLDFEVRNHVSEETAQRIRQELDAAHK